MPTPPYIPETDRKAPLLPEYVSRILHAFFSVGDTFTGDQMTDYLRILYAEEFEKWQASLKHSIETHIPGMLSVEYQTQDMLRCDHLAQIKGNKNRYEVTKLPLQP